MKQPFRQGQTVAWLEPHPRGILVHRTTIRHIEPSVRSDRWLVTTDRGHATVNHEGVSAKLLPIDNEIAADLYVRGDGYLVQPTLTDEIQIVRDRTRGLDSENDIDMGRDVDLGDDLGLD